MTEPNDDAAPAQRDDGGEGGEPSAHSSPYPMSRLAPAFGLVDVAREIEAADTVLAAVASAELEAIARHIRALRAEAEAVLERTRRDAELHRAECRFQRRAGQVYHLYREPSGRRYFSLLSPADWRGAPPHAFEGSFQLGLDMRWQPVAADAAESGARALQLGPGGQ